LKFGMNDLSDQELELIALFRQLNERRKNMLIETARYYLNQQRRWGR